MVVYECCKNTSMKQIYEAFKIGFSDYIIKSEISLEDFEERFFGPEGNELEKSFIAMDGEKPVGLILSGIKKFDGKETIRCGTLCIDPKYRGGGVSDELFYLHKSVAIKNNCEQLFLEVISQNDRAMRFYTKLGYNKKYDLFYYKNREIDFLKEKEIAHRISEIDFIEFSSLKKKLENIHINWQNDFDYMEKLKNTVKYFAIYKKSDIKAALAIGKTGKIYSMWVDKAYRKRSMATDLLVNAIQDLKLNSLYISFPNNIEIEDFLNRLNFKKEDLSQYEMYLVL